MKVLTTHFFVTYFCNAMVLPRVRARARTVIAVICACGWIKERMLYIQIDASLSH